MEAIRLLLAQFGSHDHAVVLGVMGGMFVYGILSLLAGYRLLRMMIFLVGFAVGTYAASFFWDGLLPVLVGLVSGAVLIVLWYVGLFLLGAGLGSLLAMALGFENPTIICIFALVGGVLALVIRKLIIIVSTSYSGASVLVGLACMFVKNMPPQVVFLLTLGLTIVGIVVQYLTTRKVRVAAAAAPAPAVTAPAAAEVKPSSDKQVDNPKSGGV